MRMPEEVRGQCEGLQPTGLGNGMMEDETYGQINYAAYCVAVESKTWDGRPCPTWDELTQKIRNAWCAGAAAVIVERDSEARVFPTATDDGD